MFEPSRRSHSYHSSSMTMTYTFHHGTETPPPETITIPVTSPPHKTAATPTSIPSQSLAQAATLIQSAYRGHVTRALFRTISSVDARTTLLQRRIQRQDTVDTIRADEKERLRLNEELMGLLLTLDGIRGVDEGIRMARRKASRRIVGLQEIVDGVCESQLGWEQGKGDNRWGGFGYWWEDLEAMEEKMCRERGGDEMEEFCARYLGFRCLQRFLQDA